MNDRIQELAIQTDIWCDQNVAQGSPMYNNQWEHKFAELIVRECIAQMAIHMDKFGDEQSNNPVWYKAEEAVMKHFGVE